MRLAAYQPFDTGGGIRAARTVKGSSSSNRWKCQGIWRWGPGKHRDEWMNSSPDTKIPQPFPAEAGHG